MTDLWPDKLDDLNIRAPVALLREQAALLGQKTKNLIEAEVENGTNVKGNFTYHFFIVAPTLNNYHYRLFTIEHEITLYPVLVYLGEELGQEIVAQPISQKSLNMIERVQLSNEQTLHQLGFISKLTAPYFLAANSEDEFVEVLKSILNSKVTLRVVSALLAQLSSRLELAPAYVQTEPLEAGL